MCANCLRRSKRLTSVAWSNLCPECTELARVQMELVFSHPAGHNINIFRCRDCGRMRTAQDGWTVRCMVCLDERTQLFRDEMERLMQLVSDTRYRQQVGLLLGVPTRQGGWREIHEALTIEIMADHELSLSWPGWHIFAYDIPRLPWVFPAEPGYKSHGTWALHGACFTLASLRKGRVPDCKVCPPEEGRRTYRAKADTPAFLYLVQYDRWVKYGYGLTSRVNGHLRDGCELVQVLQGRHEDVTKAERQIARYVRERRLAAAVEDRPKFPASWRKGTEVVLKKAKLDLRSFLSGDDVADVTARFRW